jgi:hypothetical protein
MTKSLCRRTTGCDAKKNFTRLYGKGNSRKPRILKPCTYFIRRGMGFRQFKIKGLGKVCGKSSAHVGKHHSVLFSKSAARTIHTQIKRFGKKRYKEYVRLKRQ